MTCGYCGAACWIAKAAAGVIRSSQSSTPTGSTEATLRMYGSTIATTTMVIAATLRRSTAPRARASTAATASSAAVPATARSSVVHVTGNRYALLRPSWVPRITAAAAAARPTTKVTAPITRAFAASTRPRRGLAASVVRIRPRRYSAVMNMAAITSTPISPAKVPTRRFAMVSDGPPLSDPATTGAMSPDPVTANRPPAW